MRPGRCDKAGLKALLKLHFEVEILRPVGDFRQVAFRCDFLLEIRTDVCYYVITQNGSAMLPIEQTLSAEVINPCGAKIQN